MTVELVTGLFGDYEPLRSLPLGVTGTCFSDDEHTAQGWTTRTLPLATARRLKHRPRLRNRYVKALAHKLTDAEVVLYVDASFKILADPTAWALDALGDADFAAYAHPLRDCVYAEAEVCIKKGRGDPDAVRAQVERYRAAGLPRASGLFGGGILVRRLTPRVRAFGDAWWREIAAGSERDQLSLGFLAWRLGLQIRVIPGVLYKPPFALYRGHVKRKA